MELPKAYAWLAAEPGPRILLEMIKIYGTVEAPGPKNNPEILRWADEIGLGNIYKADSTAWCGLTMAYVAAEAGWDHAPRGNALWARNWADWGKPIDKDKAMLGDVLVFARGSAGHVALYVGEDATHFHIIGGNQDNLVSIKRRKKSQLIAVRRCPWRTAQPPNVRKILLNPNASPAGGSEA